MVDEFRENQRDLLPNQSGRCVNPTQPTQLGFALRQPMDTLAPCVAFWAHQRAVQIRHQFSALCLNGEIYTLRSESVPLRLVMSHAKTALHPRCNQFQYRTGAHQPLATHSDFKHLPSCSINLHVDKIKSNVQLAPPQHPYHFKIHSWSWKELSTIEHIRSPSPYRANGSHHKGQERFAVFWPLAC